MRLPPSAAGAPEPISKPQNIITIQTFIFKKFDYEG